jgi:hypothetical protein
MPSGNVEATAPSIQPSTSRTGGLSFMRAFVVPGE